MIYEIAINELTGLNFHENCTVRTVKNASAYIFNVFYRELKNQDLAREAIRSVAYSPIEFEEIEELPWYVESALLQANINGTISDFRESFRYLMVENLLKTEDAMNVCAKYGVGLTYMRENFGIHLNHNKARRNKYQNIKERKESLRAELYMIDLNVDTFGKAKRILADLAMLDAEGNMEQAGRIMGVHPTSIRKAIGVTVKEWREKWIY